MLKPALLYKEELEKKFAETFYNLKYQYFYHGTANNIPEIPNSNKDFHCFASVNDKGEVLGYVSYGVDWESMCNVGFGAISFTEGGSVEYANDLRQAIDDIFCKYNFNRIEWWAYADNPAIRGYKSFIKRYGGKEAGYLRQNVKLMDGKLHDTIIFEVMRDDYLAARYRMYTNRLSLRYKRGNKNENND